MDHDFLCLWRCVIILFPFLAFCNTSPITRLSTIRLPENGNHYEMPSKMYLSDAEHAGSANAHHGERFPSIASTSSIDVDHLDDASLHALLLHHLGGDTEGLLHTLFGDAQPHSRAYPSDKSKRSDSRPQFDPGWKFIGLGKRRFPHSRPYRRASSSQHNEGEEKGDMTDPFLSALALSNLDEFFQALKTEIEKPDEEKENPKAVEAMTKEEELKATGSQLNPRFSNTLSWWGKQPKTLYDPSWMFTGLGR